MSQCQEFLTIHANLVLATPRVPFKSPLNLQALQAYMADDDLKIKHSEYMHSREFLYMPVHKSPLLIALIPRPWHYRYTDTFASISTLWSIISCFTTLLNLPRDELIQELDDLDDKMFEDIKNMSQEQFINYMAKFTIDKIQMYERFIWKTFKLKVPMEYILTPHMYPTIKMLCDEDKLKYNERMAHCFETKEILRNVKMEKASPEGEYVAKSFFPSKGRDLFEYYNFLINE